MLHFGFSYVGLIYLLMLFIPNIIWTKHQPEGYAEYAAKESKILQAFEKVGEVLVCVFVLIFSDFNVRLDTEWGLWWFASLVLMLMYEYYWVQYFRSEKKMSDFYRSICGIPVAGATLPVCAFFLLGVYGGNIFLMVAVVILGIGHIGIHWIHYREICGEKKRKKGLKRMLGIVTCVILFLIFVPIAVVIGIRNYNYVKHYVGSEHGVDEEVYVLLNGQEQYLLIKGENEENPVIVYLHGGPAGPDSMATYVFSKYLTDEYTVVAWDQRGCGNTYYRNKDTDPENKTATFEQALADLDKLVEYLCERFGQEQVIIMGHSYGTLLGSRYVLEHPDKVSNYVGIGQMVSIKAAEKASYEDALKIAAAKGDDTTKLLSAYEMYTQDSSINNMMNLRKLTLPYHVAPKAKNTIIIGLLSPYLRVNATKWQLKAMIDMEGYMELNQSLLEFTNEVDLMELPIDYQVPVAFVTGSCDWACPAICTKEYMEAITAPEKELVLMEGCGHSPHFDEPEEFAEILKGILK